MRASDVAFGSWGDVVDSGAGGRDRLVVVADGIGGHVTGWLASRLALRKLCGDSARFSGAGDAWPRAWGWAGAQQDSGAAAEIYAACESLFGEPQGPELADMFAALRTAIGRMPELPYRLSRPFTGCLAVRISASQLTGAHTGPGRALLCRDGVADRLVEEHLVFGNVITAALGLHELRVDTFERRVTPGDVIVLSSRPLPITDDEIARLVDDDTPVEQHAERLARLAGEWTEELTPISFAIARL